MKLAWSSPLHEAHLILPAPPGSTQEGEGKAERSPGANSGQAQAGFISPLLRLIIWNPEESNFCIYLFFYVECR